MLIFKFTKTDNSSLVAHVDTLRAVTYIFRRARVDVEYSKGFNPHMELGFSAPISLGIESVAEYVSAKADFQPDALDKLNANCPKGIQFLAMFNKKVNLAATLNRAEYILTANGIGNVIDQILAPNYTISYTEKKVEVQKDVSSRIFAAERIDDNNAKVVLACGNANLRPDRLVLHLMATNNLTGDYKIVKTQMFVDDIPADDFLCNNN